MDSTRFRRCRAIFEQAVDLDAAARAAFVREACAGDEHLLAAVRDMLAADGADEQARFLSPAHGQATAQVDLVGVTVGEFRIVECLGSGGMGSVYVAEQDNPRRRVAVKVLGTLFPTPRLLRRFQVEAEILAGLEHPGIAKVIQAGVHALTSGEAKLEFPWYAMELLEGARPITTFAREHGLGRAARLQLGIAVCDAIHHAHSRGVVHRDVKPANVLVDRGGQPKVIDFGVARRQLGEGASMALTARGELVGTPAYMAPEQLTGDPEAVDTRADVYALGVLLYELLCDALPFAMEGRSLTEIIDMVRQREPRRPRDAAPDLPAELEWVLLKALAKVPEERYASAAELRDDLRRFGAHEPVLAGPPSAGYRLRKFVRRNRLAVGAAGAIVLALAAGLVVSLRALDRARLAERQAVREASVSKRVLDLFKGALRQAQVEQRGKDLRVVDALDFLAKGVPTLLKDEPHVESVVHGNLGELYYSVGNVEAGEREMRAALEAVLRSEAAESSDAVQVYSNLIQILVGRGRPTEALELLEPAVALSERVLPPDDVYRLSLLHRRGAALLSMRRFAEAEAAFRRAYAARLAAFGPDSQDSLESLNSLSLVVAEQGRVDEAEVLTRQVVDGLTNLVGADHAFTVQARENLALLRRDRGDHAGALELLTPLLAAKETAHGPDHPSTLRSRGYRVELLAALGRHEEARAAAADLRAAAAARLGETHPFTLQAAASLGRALVRLDRPDDAIAELRTALAAAGDADRQAARAALGDLHALLGRALGQRGELDAAEASLTRGCELLGEESPKAKEARRWLAEVRGRRGEGR